MVNGYKYFRVKEETWKQLMRLKLEKGYKSIDELIQKEHPNALPCAKKKK